MKCDQLVREIKRARGPVYAAISSTDEVHYVQIVKADAIDYFSRRFENDEETGLVLWLSNGKFYIDKQYGV